MIRVISSKKGSVGKMKKTLSFILVLALVLAMLSIPALALTEGDWEFTLQNGEALITGYNGVGGDVTIPSTLRGATVVSIDGFYQNSNITSLTIPGTVRSIDRAAFYCASALETVTIMEGVQTIGKEAFSCCASLREVNIPLSACDGLADRIFLGCPSLTKVTLPEGMTKTSYQMFADCTALAEISFPSTMEVIGGSSFSNTALKSVVIPARVKEIESCAFSHTPLEEVKFAGTALTTIGSFAFDCCNSLETLYLPVSVKSIGTAIVGYSESFKGLAVPYGCTSIGYSVMRNCPNAEWLSIPSSVTDIDRAAEVCPNLIVYCPAGSAAEKVIQKDSISVSHGYNVSYLTDPSADSPIQVIYNGSRISFGAYGQNPTIVNSRTMVPLRSIFEAMGARVEWDAATHTASAVRNGVSISITIGSSIMLVNGREVALDSPAVIMNDRTMVPVRAIAEAFGADVDWVPTAQIVTIDE